MHILRLGLVAALAVGAAFSSAALAEHVSDELLVKFVPGKGALVNQPIGAVVKNYNTSVGVSTIKLPSSMSVEQALTYYRSKTDVIYADPNYIAHATFTPNDPMFNQQYGPQKIQCPAAWDNNTGVSSVTIAIIDTGIDKTHPDLAAKVFGGYDFINNDDDASDDNGHGTHCAGVSAGITNNGVGIAGVAPNCRLMPVKVLSAAGSGSYDAIVNGITYAANNGANILSMSLGGSADTQALDDAVNYAFGKNCVVVAAAGNNGVTDKFYPAAIENCIAVAATDSNDQKAGFSNYGADWVDVAAPGVDILSTLPNNSYGAESGTSMACPHVAGVAGLVRSAMLTASAATVRARIESTCDNVGNFIAFGRVNAFRAAPPLITLVPYAFAPSTIAIYEGLASSGTVAYAQTSDNRYFTVNSKLVDRTGQVASATSTFVSAKPVSSFNGLSFKVEAQAVPNVTCSLFIWNYTTNAWVYVNAFPLGSTDATKSFAISAPFSPRYFNSARTAKVLIRAIMPNTTYRPAVPYTLKIDQLQANTKVPSN